MTLIAGTRSGVFRTTDPTTEDAERVLDSGDTFRVRTFDVHDAVYAASKNGLYRSMDDGLSWKNLDVPQKEVYAVVVSPDGERLYAGTHPAYIYVSTDDGETWDELDGFRDLPSRKQWPRQRHRNAAQVRSLDVHPDVPERVIAGVEVGGVHVSDDEGETWSERRSGVNDDIHGMLVVGPDEYIASCGVGLYRTRDAGLSWTRLGSDIRRTYFRDSLVHQGRLYTAAARTLPPQWRRDGGADAVVLESSDDGETFDQRSYPGSPAEVILAWTVADGDIVTGTNTGQVLTRDGEDSWISTGELPSGFRSLTTVS